uniref:Bifunctional inhibitor/plant lipid transfer protein/seed storage helical domain-containing protein n=1 Tax=Oryza punctata TaxID=4537 RepID=A0A0E0M9G3_ORYPU
MAKWAAAMELLLLVAVAVAVVAAQTTPPPPQCDPGLLAPCAGPIFFGTTPSDSCCSNLRAQQGCFCNYASDPAYASYINSTNARKTIAACGIPFPSC